MYSITMTKKVTDNLCVRCETRFQSWSLYHAHVTGPKCVLKIVAINTSGRNRTQIIVDWESKQKEGAII